MYINYIYIYIIQYNTFHSIICYTELIFYINFFIFRMVLINLSSLNNTGTIL